MDMLKNRLSKVYDFDEEIIEEMYSDLVCTITATPNLSERLTILTDWLDYRTNYFTLIWLVLNGAIGILFTEN